MTTLIPAFSLTGKTPARKAKLLTWASRCSRTNAAKRLPNQAWHDQEVAFADHCDDVRGKLGEYEAGRGMLRQGVI